MNKLNLLQSNNCNNIKSNKDILKNNHILCNKKSYKYTNTSCTKNYWCHLCKKEFSKLYIENTEVYCRLCGKTFCEEIDSDDDEDHPSNYQPFEYNNRRRIFNNNDSNNNISTNRTSTFREASRMLDILSSLLSFNEESHMENIINYLMANDPNKYGNPPASKEEVENLERIIIDNENKRKEINNIVKDGGCSVCKDEYELNQKIIKLPCSHLFHDDCIMPWLKERNSCPTCRYELKTDDKDYEERKNTKREELRNSVVSNNNNVINENIGNEDNNDDLVNEV